MAIVLIDAEPEPIAIDPATTALVIIDMQRDFLEPGGFGETLGNDVSLLAAAVAPCRTLLDHARRAGMLVIHTREGHLPDLSDAPPAKIERGAPSLRIGAPGPMGRILIRGEPGHQIIAALAPLPGEPVIDKPGKGAFFSTTLDALLREHRIESLIVCGASIVVRASQAQALPSKGAQYDRRRAAGALRQHRGQRFPLHRRFADRQVNDRGEERQDNVRVPHPRVIAVRGEGDSAEPRAEKCADLVR